ncbi:helix-turn-helix domain-containing protein [Streptomyces hyaluromycini]|uniref:Helix-turn-helix domain-containing protein n=1 Tax=Streptomyces hyaluromycini TaxID=1377993 RepID=A0ABV1WX21_9ACTN
MRQHDEAMGRWEIVAGRPHPALRPGILSYRGIRIALDRPRRRLETPIGAATLLLGFGEPIRISRDGRPPATLVCVCNGLATTPAIGEHGGRISGIEVLLMPWAAFSLFGTPQYELANRSVDPDELPHTLGHGVGELAAALGALPRWADRFRLLDDVLLRWSRAGVPGSPQVERAWALLRRDWGAVPVPRLADEVGWSVRHLENRFRERIGLGPKAAARVLRLQRARRMLAAGRGQAETAAVCGFYDQAHLSGEFKAMTGCTPGEFVAARAAAASASADRMSGQATSLVLGPGAGSAVFSKTGAGRVGHADHQSL